MTTTLDQAIKLADQDCPLPSLAGPALKVLRDRVRELEAASPAGVPDGWRITPERNPLGGKPAMRLHAPDGRSALFGTFSEEVLARDFLYELAAAPSAKPAEAKEA